MTFSLTNKYHLLHFVRGFIHLTVLTSLIIYQFLFSLFINSYLSLSLYGLCSVFLLLDGLYLFFYKDNKLFNHFISGIFLFLEACFFVVLATVLGLVGLPFVLSLVFLEIVALSLCGGWIYGVLFSFLLSCLFLLSFVWNGDFSYESRKSLVTFVFFSFFMSVVFGSFLNSIWNKLSKKISQLEEKVSYYRVQRGFDSLGNLLGNPLDLSRKIRPSLDSLMKGFLDFKKQQSFPKYYESQLKHLQIFIGKYIHYLESEEYHFESVHLPQLLKKVLKKLQNHKDRPAFLEESLEYKSSVEWILCSVKQFETAIENIIENSFQSFKQEPKPKIDIQIYDEDNKIVLEFIDNGHGIEESDKKNLFDPLFSKRFGMGGVGLAYVLKIVKAHKGEIDIVSTSKGTKVCIKLPLLSNNKSKMSLTA